MVGSTLICIQFLQDLSRRSIETGFWQILADLAVAAQIH